MNIFQKIIQHRAIGLENYCTDILVGLLQKDSNYQLLHLFVEEVLGIKGNKAKIYVNSQCYYPELGNSLSDAQLNTSKAFVDIRISSTDFVCFLEMKVDSKENAGINPGKSQLTKYAQILSGIKTKNKYLMFCTKYREEKNILSTWEGVVFKQFRWLDIYTFFSKNQKDDIIKEFVTFMEIKNMDNKTIESNEIQSAATFINLLKKLNIVINNITDKCKELGLNNPERRHLDFNRSRLGLHYINCFDKTCNFFIGFVFEGNEIICQVNFWSAKLEMLPHQKLTSLKYQILKYDGDGSASYCIEEKINNKKSLIEIEEWFVQKINEIIEWKE